MISIPVEPPITEYLHMKAIQKKIPLSGTFELTPVCNMNCKMCYVRMSKEQQEAIRPLRTAEEWIRLGEVAKEQGMLYLLLTGGEPFLRDDFREIFQSLHRMGLVLSINSNGTLIDEETMQWLKETPPTRINITLYGASDETYERLCGNPKGFTQVTKALRLLREAGITVKLNCSLTPYNAGDLKAVMKFAEKEKLIIQATSYMFPPLRKDGTMIGKNDRFTPEEAAYYSAEIERYLNGDEAFLERMKDQNFPALAGDSEEDCLDIEGEGVRCRAGQSSFWLTWDGRMLPCGMFPGEDAANVFDTGFKEAWEGVLAETEAIRLPAKCKSCKLSEECRVCAAMAYTETGDYRSVPVYRCEMAHAYPKQCQRVEEEIRKERGC